MEKIPSLPILSLPDALPLQVLALQEHFDPLGRKPHANDYYLLLWVTGGTGSLMAGWRRYDLAAGSLFFIHPGQVHQMLAYPAKGWLLRIRPELYQSFVQVHRDEEQLGFFDRYNRLPFVILDNKWQVIFGSTFNLLAEESAKEQHANQNILRHYLSILLLYANQFHPAACTAARNTDNAKLMRDFKALLDIHYQVGHPLEFYAQAMGIGAGPIRQAVKRCTDKRPEDLANDRLITALENRLALSEASLPEIALELGFAKVMIMNIFFSRYHELAPSDFRQRYRDSQV